jgi:hypothetical protein
VIRGPLAPRAHRDQCAPAAPLRHGRRPFNFTVRGHACATTMISLFTWATWSLSM